MSESRAAAGGWAEYRIAVLEALKRLEVYCADLDVKKADSRELAAILAQLTTLSAQLASLQIESAITKTKLLIYSSIPSALFGAGAGAVINYLFQVK